jgi:hypothetical protein
VPDSTPGDQRRRCIELHSYARIRLGPNELPLQFLDRQPHGVVGGSSHGFADRMPAKVPDTKPKLCLNVPSGCQLRQQERSHRVGRLGNTLSQCMKLAADARCLQFMGETLRVAYRCCSPSAVGVTIGTPRETRRVFRACRRAGQHEAIVRTGQAA